MITVGGFGALLLSVLVGYFIISRIIALLPRVVSEFDRIANGHLVKTKPVSENQDEIGDMCRALGGMKRSLEDIIGKVRGTADHLIDATKEMAEATDAMQSSVANQQQDVQRMTHSIHELSETSANIAENASLAQQAATAADDDTQAGHEIVSNVVLAIGELASEVSSAAEAVNKLAHDSENIGSILDVIRNIAEQTNLLALNAAIEAARAGEQGRGFAVVADEVRVLASRTQQSTQEIQTMIEGLQSDTRGVVEVMERGRERAEQSVVQVSGANGSLESISQAVRSIKDMNIQIAAACEQQSAVAHELNQQASGINLSSESNAVGIRQIGTSSHQLQKLSDALHALVGHFKVEF
jgi:methyl-accepting chemotaxis protein